ncbi:MAG: NAD(P)-dependent alcohol dehydrogenase [Leptospiraceae bacterium]|nr:NAD(P)-dependent alcohol dehydrogenase [Leptospiraceae bacterium]MCP5500564.1 NAD(P)-dependent alcohol dehydrogenase [Leptospiraceae bacterium]
MKVKAYAAHNAKSELVPFEYEAGLLSSDEVDIKVESCGICHSDLSMLDNDWGMTQYPFVPGHEVIGTILEIGNNVQDLKVGDKVGLGWMSGSCMSCDSCMSGDHNLCNKAEQTIVGRHGGFADRVRSRAEWLVKIPEGLNPNATGPLFCGGITVFAPILQNNIKPIDRVGVIGMGGLGHLAILFLKAWGCEVTVFSSSPEKEIEAKKLGAHRFVNSTDPNALQKHSSSLDFIISTVNVSLDWSLYLSCLKPKGKLHVVGAVLTPLSIPAFSLISGSKSVSGSPVGSPYMIRKMLEFCARHKIEAITEEYKFSEVNKALERLRSGKARYRIVLTH